MVVNNHMCVTTFTFYLDPGLFLASFFFLIDEAAMFTLKRVKLKWSLHNSFIAQNVLVPFQSASCKLLFKNYKRRRRAAAAAWAQSRLNWNGAELGRIFSVNYLPLSSFGKSRHLNCTGNVGARYSKTECITFYILLSEIVIPYFTLIYFLKIVNCYITSYISCYRFFPNIYWKAQEERRTE